MTLGPVLILDQLYAALAPHKVNGGEGATGIDVAGFKRSHLVEVHHHRDILIMLSSTPPS